MEAAKQAADLEQKEYNELLAWLTKAEEQLQTVVDRPVHDRQKEYKVCPLIYFSYIFFSSFVRNTISNIFLHFAVYLQRNKLHNMGQLLVTLLVPC